jgi:hypothetical protein
MSSSYELQSRKRFARGKSPSSRPASLSSREGIQRGGSEPEEQGGDVRIRLSLYEYDSAIAGVQKNIGMRQAKLVELGEKAQAFEMSASQSRYAASGSPFRIYRGGSAAFGGQSFGAYSTGVKNKAIASGNYPAYQSEY